MDIVIKGLCKQFGRVDAHEVFDFFYRGRKFNSSGFSSKQNKIS